MSPTTAYTYFSSSKDALIAEVYLRLLQGAAVHVDVNDAAETRVKAQPRDLLLLVADRPHLADACTTAVMADDSAVDDVRARIAGEIGRRIASSLGPGYRPEVAETLHLLFSGATVHARSNPGGYGTVADQPRYRRGPSSAIRRWRRPRGVSHMTSRYAQLGRAELAGLLRNCFSSASGSTGRGCPGPPSSGAERNGADRDR